MGFSRAVLHSLPCFRGFRGDAIPNANDLCAPSLKRLGPLDRWTKSAVSTSGLVLHTDMPPCSDSMSDTEIHSSERRLQRPARSWCHKFWYCHPIDWPPRSGSEALTTCLDAAWMSCTVGFGTYRYLLQLLQMQLRSLRWDLPCI